jgi:hypothetical protein
MYIYTHTSFHELIHNSINAVKYLGENIHFTYAWDFSAAYSSSPETSTERNKVI